jgi:hypothetical protein
MEPRDVPGAIRPRSVMTTSPAPTCGAGSRNLRNVFAKPTGGNPIRLLTANVAPEHAHGCCSASGAQKVVRLGRLDLADQPFDVAFVLDPVRSSSRGFRVTHTVAYMCSLPFSEFAAEA